MMANHTMFKALSLLALLVYGIPHLNFSQKGSPAFVFSVVWLGFALVAFIAQTKKLWMTLDFVLELHQRPKGDNPEHSGQSFLKNH
ncbi:hypothetical protein QUF84_19460 [Fictibacillus enclensis]|uniref:hypothetical protein n=1 Tax=Fictibacillus enclensis TaxID=1017270 RepID=UPI0025A0B7A9|nr:hypothetical protein [Fictibacillus enclensis]MDM5339381.1 hypothetical protein [Fictibacillus enclensis]